MWPFAGCTKSEKIGEGDMFSPGRFQALLAVLTVSSYQTTAAFIFWDEGRCKRGLLEFAYY
jgi:hypothetical protein